MKHGRIQAKDIPDQDVLLAIAALTIRGELASTHEIHWALSDLPEKVVLAKLRSMARRGLVDTQCDCGCYGPWSIRPCECDPDPHFHYDPNVSPRDPAAFRIVGLRPVRIRVRPRQVWG